jgi:hypothetical protein
MRPISRLRALLLFALISGCATSSPQTSTEPIDVTGTWKGTADSRSVFAPASDLILELKQAGAKVSGNATPGGALEGTVTGSGFSYRLADGGGGDVTVSGTEMTGYAHKGAVLSLRRAR